MDHSYATLRATRVSPAVALLELHRPHRLNAMNPAFWADARAFFTRVAADPAVRAIVVASSSEKIFTAGLDLAELPTELASAGDRELARRVLTTRTLIKDWQAAFTAIEACGKVVLAAVNGACIGGGVDLITACDMRYCTADARFSVKEIDLAMTADIGTLQRLPKAVGNASTVRELCFTGRAFSAQEALALGLVTRVYADRDAMLTGVLAIAAEIATKSPVALLGTKLTLNHARDHSVDEGLDFVAQWNASMLHSEDLAVAITSSMQKQTPVYAKL